jgi:hypothetical protein
LTCFLLENDKAAKIAIIVCLAEFFCHTTTERGSHEGDTLDKLHAHLIQRAKDGNFASPETFVNAYDPNYYRFIVGKPVYSEGGNGELLRFARTTRWWFPRVLNISDQQQRATAVDKVLEYVKKTVKWTYDKDLNKGLRGVLQGMLGEDVVSKLDKGEQDREYKEQMKLLRLLYDEDEDDNKNGAGI